jgi:hypothetical protein
MFACAASTPDHLEAHPAISTDDSSGGEAAATAVKLTDITDGQVGVPLTGGVVVLGVAASSAMNEGMHLHAGLQERDMPIAAQATDSITVQEQHTTAGRLQDDVQQDAEPFVNQGWLASWSQQGAIRKLQQQQYTVVGSTTSGSGSTTVVTYTMVLPCTTGCVAVNKIETQIKNYINQQVCRN